MKILSIGDIHGRNNWEGFVDDYSYDLCIFIGDYVDSFDISNQAILDNLKNIIEFKKEYGDDAVLLLGNHDLQYLYSYSGYGCSGFRAEMYHDLHEIFNNNHHLFTAAYAIGNYLWTHAGVNKYWYEERAKAELQELVEHGGGLTDADIDRQLNVLFGYNKKCLFDVGYRRGGYEMRGGIFWADMNEMAGQGLKGYHQIVGHTIVPEIFTDDIDDETSVTFIDCLNKPFIIDI